MSNDHQSDTSGADRRAGVAMTCRRALLLLLLAISWLANASSQAQIEPPVQFCKRVGTDDTLRALPRVLAPDVRRLFNLDMPDEAVMRTSFFRCMTGGVMVCTIGANLPCGKAKTRRSLASVQQYCRQHPGSDVVPVVVTGHDTIYQWHCEGTSAVAGGETAQRDARGFFARYWQRVQ